MRVYIIRHGKAYQDSDTGRDEDRALRGRGERQSAYLGRELAGMEPAIGLVLVSPIRRARETAAGIVAGLESAGLDVEVRVERRLETGRAPSDGIAGIAEAVAQADTRLAVAVVGHNPQVGEIVGVLTNGVGGGNVLRTGQCVALEVGPSLPVGGAKVVGVLRLEEEQTA